MIGVGTLVNIVAILVGSSVGAVVGDRLTERSRTLTTDILGLITVLNGALSLKVVLSGDMVDAIGDTWVIFLLLAALLLGGLVGSLLRVEDRLDGLGQQLRAKLARGSGQGSFVEGFVTASLVFCIGPLAIMGAFDDAMGLGTDKLILKSVLDLFASMAFAASFGWGVAASAIAVGVYQGLLTVVGLGLGTMWDAAQIDAMTAVGGLLLIAIGLRLLHMKQIAIGNLLPSLFLAPYLLTLFALYS